MTIEYKKIFFEKLVFPPNTPLGDNLEIIEYLWNILNELYINGDDLIKNIILNFLNVKDIIQIFPSTNKSEYLKSFGVLNLNLNETKQSIIHELGHFYNHLVLKNELPINFDLINQNATTHAKNKKECCVLD